MNLIRIILISILVIFIITTVTGIQTTGRRGRRGRNKGGRGGNKAGNVGGKKPVLNKISSGAAKSATANSQKDCLLVLQVNDVYKQWAMFDAGLGNFGTDLPPLKTANPELSSKTCIPDHKGWKIKVPSASSTSSGGQKKPVPNSGGQKKPAPNSGGQKKPAPNSGGQKKPVPNGGGKKKPNRGGKKKPNRGGRKKPNRGGRKKPKKKKYGNFMEFESTSDKRGGKSSKYGKKKQPVGKKNRKQARQARRAATSNKTGNTAKKRFARGKQSNNKKSSKGKNTGRATNKRQAKNKNSRNSKQTAAKQPKRGNKRGGNKRGGNKKTSGKKKGGKCGGAKALGGLHNFVYTVEMIKKNNPNCHVLVVLPGDYLSPSYMTQKAKLMGSFLTEAMALAGVQVCVLGNHEFDLGLGGLRDSLKRTPCVTLAANVHDLCKTAKKTSKFLEESEEVNQKKVNKQKGGASQASVSKVGGAGGSKMDSCPLLFSEVAMDGNIESGIKVGGKVGFKNNEETDTNSVLKDLKIPESYIEKTHKGFTNFQIEGSKGQKRNGEYITISYPTTKGTAKVCIFGVSEKTPVLSGSKKTVHARDHIGVAKAILGKLKRVEKCDVTLAATHQVWKYDMELIDFMQKSKAFDKRRLEAVLGAHDHFPVFYQTKFKGKPNKGAVLIKTGSDAKYLAALKLNLADQIMYHKDHKTNPLPTIGLEIFHVDAMKKPWVPRNKQGGKPEQQMGRDEIRLEKEPKDDIPMEKAKKAIAAMKFYDFVSGASKKRKVVSKSNFKGAYRTNHVRESEERGSNFLADLLRFYVRGVNVVGIAGGGVRGDVASPIGFPQLTALDFAEETPYGGEMGVMKVSANRLAGIVYGSISNYDPGKGNNENLIHLSGLVVIYDSKNKNKILFMALNPAHIGGRDGTSEEAFDNGRPNLIYCSPDASDHGIFAAICKEVAKNQANEDIYFSSMLYHMLYTKNPPTKGPWNLNPQDILVSSPTTVPMDEMFMLASNGIRLPAKSLTDAMNTPSRPPSTGYISPQHPPTDMEVGESQEEAKFIKNWGDEPGVDENNVLPGQYRLKALGTEGLKCTGPHNTLETAAKCIIKYEGTPSLAGALLDEADEILTRYTPTEAPRFLESKGPLKLFNSLHGSDINAFVEEAISYGFPKDKRQWLHDYATNAYKSVRRVHLNHGARVKELHAGLHHLYQ